MNAIVTVVGEDKVGIIAAVDVGGSSASIGELRTMLEDLGGKMGISIRIQREEIFDAMHRI